MKGRLVILGALLLLPACRMSNQTYFNGVVERLNRKLPQQMDAEITRDKVRYDAASNTFTFTYRVNKPGAQIAREYTKESLLPNIRKVVEMNEEDVTGRGVNYAMEYASGLDGQKTIITYTNQELRALAGR